MFFKSKICSVNANTNECDSIKRIRELQAKLDEVRKFNENFDASRQLEKILNTNNPFFDARYSYDMEKFFRFFVGKAQAGNKTCEEVFSELGKKLDEWNNTSAQISSLEREIQAEKDKLGIK